jgi:hypothetical protein
LVAGHSLRRFLARCRAVQCATDGQARGKPTALEGSLGNAQGFGRFNLGEALVPEQVKDRALVVGKGVDSLMELGPRGEPARVVGALGDVVEGLDARVRRIATDV